MRTKHIVLPIAVLTVIGIYGLYDNIQKSKFDSNLWKADIASANQEKRYNLVSPLMVHTLKFGMSLEEVDRLLGPPDEERSAGTTPQIGSPDRMLIYRIKQKDVPTISIVLEFSHKQKLTDFYVEGAVRPLLY